MNRTVPFLGILKRSYLMIVLSIARIVVVLPLFEICAAPARTCAPFTSFPPRAASAQALHTPLAVSETAAATAIRPRRVGTAHHRRPELPLDETFSLPRID